MASKSGVLYVGVTIDLSRRVQEHKLGEVKGFTSRYRVVRLLYFEDFGRPLTGDRAGNRTQGWLRKRKLDLIRTMNPKFVDLSEAWVE